MSKTYCNEAWRTIHFSGSGNPGPCCTFRLHRPKIETATEYWNSTWLADVRQKMLNGEQVDGCQNCYRKEQRGERSQRIEKNDKHGYITTPTVKELYVSFGNICNKTCNICRPQRSHLIAKEYKQISSDNPWLQNKVHTQPNILKALDKSYSRIFIEKDNGIDDILRTVEVVHLDGGEPFITKQCDDLIDNLIDKGLTDITIKATTNGSVRKDQLDKLKKFKKVSFHLSVDGVNTLYEAVRPPHNWRWWNHQHSLIRSYGFNVVYACVVHAFNVHQLPRILEYFISNKMEPGFSEFYFSTLNDQEYLGCDVVPDEVIDRAIKGIQKHYSQLSEFEYKNILNIERHLTKSKNTNNQHNKDMFVEYCRTFGPLKGLDFKDYIPWIKE